jgi:hypothetical protein
MLKREEMGWVPIYWGQNHCRTARGRGWVYLKILLADKCYFRKVEWYDEGLIHSMILLWYYPNITLHDYNCPPYPYLKIVEEDQRCRRIFIVGYDVDRRIISQNKIDKFNLFTWSPIFILDSGNQYLSRLSIKVKVKWMNLKSSLYSNALSSKYYHKDLSPEILPIKNVMAISAEVHFGFSIDRLQSINCASLVTLALPWYVTLTRYLLC